MLRISQVKPAKESRPTEEVESIYNGIISRLFRDVLSSEEAIGLVQEIEDQGPRLYCMFDKQDPIMVNDMRGDELVSEFGQAEENFDGEKSQTLVVHKDRMVDDDRKQQVDRLPDLGNQNRGGEIDRKENRVGQVEIKEENGHNAVNLDLNNKKVDQEEAQSQTDKNQVKKDNSKSKIHDLPAHMTPEDLMDEEERREIEEEENDEVAMVDSISQDRINQLLTKDEFKIAAQKVFDEVFLSMIKDSVRNNMNLNDKRIVSSHKTNLSSQKTQLMRLRSQVVANQPNSSGLSNTLNKNATQGSINN